MEKTFKKIKKYKIEIIILIIALFISVTSLIVFLKSSDEKFNQTTPAIIKPVNEKTEIYFDVSGSVNKPNLYKAPSGIRLKQVIDMAGDISINADKEFFARNFNLARIIVDQEKIYIPSVWEVNNGYFTQDPQTINYLAVSDNQPHESKGQSLININSATLEELDTIPGVGKITAQKIIDNRPFKALDELINKKIINKTVFENIISLITISDL